MKKEKLPYLNQILIKGLFTFIKGVTIGGKNIQITKEFEPFSIDKSNLSGYKKTFNFNQELPLTYLYLIAQRAQVVLMLDSKFTIAIPGLIHISNTIVRTSPVNINQSLELISDVFVESKIDGSLFPVFNVHFYQGGEKVASCKSNYIAKRKSNSKSKKINQPEPIKNESFKEIWNLSKNDAKTYAKLSGDSNPIHISSIIAKIFGFKSTIIQGWYAVSRAVSKYENITNKNVDNLTCEFYKAIELPKTTSLIIKNNMINIIDKLRVSLIIRINN